MNSPESGFRQSRESAGQDDASLEDALAVAGEQSVPVGDVAAPPKPEDVAEELKPFQVEAQALVDSHRRFFATFARDVSLEFKVSSGFFIDLERGEVHLDAKWFAEKGFSRQQALWAVLHELSHFRDMAEDPERMMGNFGYVRDQARATGAAMMAKWEAKYGGSDPELIERLKVRRGGGKKRPERAMNQVEAAAYKIHHTFFNVFDDIFVNAMVARRAPAFEAGSDGGAEVERLYREKLFKQTDYRSTPRHLQFLYALLRREMVPGQELELGADVQEALSRELLFQGKKYTAAALVEKFLKPGSRRDVKAGNRYLVLRRTLEPVFAELLAKDLAEWEPEKPAQPPEGGEPGEPQSGGDPNPFAQAYDDFSDSSPDQIDDEAMEDWLDKHEDDKKDDAARAAKQQADDALSPEERAARAAAAKDQAWCEANGVALESLRRFREVEKQIAPHLEDLAALWDRIITGASREVRRAKEGHFMTGTELDIQKVIGDWPQLEEGRMDDVRVMKRDVDKETLVRRPELIRVRLVADQSGSMDDAKRRILEQCIVLLLSSLREFNTKLNLSRRETKSALEADTEVWAFGSSAEKVKPLRASGEADREYADMVRTFESLRKSMGSTADFLALQGISRELSAEDSERIRQGKVLDIVFEITDGGSDNPGAARQAVDALDAGGFITRAFQIGQVGESDAAKFHQVWNQGREADFGQVVGEKIDDLVPAVADALKKYLKGVRL